MRARIPKKDSIIALTPYGGMCIVLDNVVDKLKRLQIQYIFDECDYTLINYCIKIVKTEQRWVKRNKERINRR